MSGVCDVNEIFIFLFVFRFHHYFFVSFSPSTPSLSLSRSLFFLQTIRREWVCDFVFCVRIFRSLLTVQWSGELENKLKTNWKIYEQFERESEGMMHFLRYSKRNCPIRWQCHCDGTRKMLPTKNSPGLGKCRCWYRSEILLPMFCWPRKAVSHSTGIQLVSELKVHLMHFV